MPEQNDRSAATRVGPHNRGAVVNLNIYPGEGGVVRTKPEGVKGGFRRLAILGFGS